MTEMKKGSGAAPRIVPQDEAVAVEASSLALTQRAEIDIQIATAKRWPRSITKFRADALTLATLDEETAGSMGYSLPRGKKPVMGPSVRLAEIVGSCWGNLRFGARIVEIGPRMLTAQGVAHDLETNVSATKDVHRRITDKVGNRYGDDMIGVTAQAAMSIALRNAIFSVVPMSLVNDLYRQTLEVALGKGLPMGARRKKAVEWFVAHQGATESDVFLVCGVRGFDDLTMDDLAMLSGLRSSIKSGETTWEAVLRESSVVEDVSQKSAESQKPEPAQPSVAPATEPSPTVLHLQGVVRGRAACGLEVASDALAVGGVDPTCSGCREAQDRPAQESEAAPAEPEAPQATAQDVPLPDEIQDDVPHEFGGLVTRLHQALVKEHEERGDAAPPDLAQQAERRAAQEWHESGERRMWVRRTKFKLR